MITKVAKLADAALVIAGILAGFAIDIAGWKYYVFGVLLPIFSSLAYMESKLGDEYFEFERPQTRQFWMMILLCIGVTVVVAITVDWQLLLAPLAAFDALLLMGAADILHRRIKHGPLTCRGNSEIV